LKGNTYCIGSAGIGAGYPFRAPPSMPDFERVPEPFVRCHLHEICQTDETVLLHGDETEIGKGESDYR